MLFISLNILIFQSNSYSKTKNQHSKYDKIFSGDDLIKMNDFFYPQNSPNSSDRKVFFSAIEIEELNYETVAKNKIKLISKKDKIRKCNMFFLISRRPLSWKLKNIKMFTRVLVG